MAIPVADRDILSPALTPWEIRSANYDVTMLIVDSPVFHNTTAILLFTFFPARHILQ